MKQCLKLIQNTKTGWAWCTDLKFGMGIDLDKILDKVDGQGHRSRSRGQNI